MTTSYTIHDDPKMLRETLCVAQNVIGNSMPAAARRDEHIERLGRLIRECDRHRPIGPNGKHGNRHTPTCGCDDSPSESQLIASFNLIHQVARHLPGATAGETRRALAAGLRELAQLLTDPGGPVGGSRIGPVGLRDLADDIDPDNSPTHPVRDCDVCGNGFEPGQWWIYHHRMRVYVHSSCAATSPVRGEDITHQTVLIGQVPPLEGPTDGI